MDIELTTGTVRGEDRDGIRLFKGIPYAAPPIGERRLAAPGPVEPWSGVREARKFARPSLQFSLFGGKPMGSEDCLYLNVYAPAEPGPHPVMVWLHGGGGVTGSPQQYDATRFAQRGVVVVTVAYRLGVLGMLYLPGIFDVNLTSLDQLAALRWVRDNVAAFGGDPDRVTLAGQSNGGRTVGTLLAMPDIAGLVRQAIVQSGTGVGYLAAQPEEALRTTDGVLAELGLDRSSAARLRELPAEKILEAQSRYAASSSVRLPYLPVVDGTVLPDLPVNRAADVPLLIGTTHDEQDLFSMVPAEFTGTMSIGSALLSDTRFTEQLDAYRSLHPDWSDDDLRRHVVTAADWWLPAIRYAEAHRGDTWMYRLDWRLSPRGKGFGAPHALDIPLVFDDIRNPNWRFLFDGARDRRDEIQTLTTTMHEAWIRFVSTGDPGWPAYTPDRRTTMLFDDPSTVTDDPDPAERALWSPK